MGVATTRATVLAIIRASNDTWLSLAGTLAWYGWRGARTVLVVVGGAQAQPVQARVKQSVSLLQVEQHFHWESLSDESLLVERLTRTLRAFHPHAVLSTSDMLPLARLGWDNATMSTVAMPGLSVVDPLRSRLWVSDGADVAMNIGAARGIKHALRLMYQDPTTLRFPLPPLSVTETFTSVAGAVVPHTATDLLDGFTQVVLQDPIYFEERRGFSVPISTHQGADPQ